MSAGALRRVTGILLIVLGILGVAPRGAGDLPAAPLEGEPCSAEDRAIEAQPVCIGSTVHSAGELGPALFYRAAHLPDGRLAVGYYVFFSEERPWGNNWLTWSLLPALALDLVYTRGLFVGPGLQRAAYGRGDVEGFRVIYAVGADGELRAESALADDPRHRSAELSRADLFTADPTRVTLVTDTWSHQLGARLGRAGELVYQRCYGAQSIRPIEGDVIRRFNLAGRAWPAAVGS
jgi:hypothetical protein